MAIDLTGVPAVVENKGSAAGRVIAAAIAEPTPIQVSMASLVDGIMLGLTDSATVVIDPNGRKVYATDNSPDAALLSGAVNTASNKKVTLTPDSGQTGKSLTWTSANSNTVEINAKIAPVVASQKPKRTLSSLIAAALQAANDPTATKKSVVVVDQAAGVVKVHELTDGELASGQTALNGLNLADGNGMVIAISEPATPGTPTPLIFEGGATS